MPARQSRWRVHGEHRRHLSHLARIQRSRSDVTGQRTGRGGEGARGSWRPEMTFATQTRVAMKHGAGGRSMRKLIERVFLADATSVAADMDDGAAIPLGDEWLIVTTDS